MMRMRADSCLSDLRLDELLAGELDLDERQPATAHLGGCPACSDRLAALERDRDGYRARPAARPMKPRRRALGVGVGIAMAAACAAILLHRPETLTTRSKGTARLGFFITHGDEVRPGGPGDKVQPGDTLSFTLSTDRRVYVAVLSRDGAGLASVYFPAGPIAEAAEPGPDVLLPLATVLDGALGTERLYGLLCDEPVALEPLRRALAGSPTLPAPPGCTLDVTTLEKVP